MAGRPGRAVAPGGPEIAPLPADAGATASPDTSAMVVAPAPAELEPEILPGPIETQRTYRQLTMLGLSGIESANMVAFLAGLAVHRTPWTMTQVNRVLFLRELYRHSGWGEVERRAP